MQLQVRLGFQNERRKQLGETLLCLAPVTGMGDRCANNHTCVTNR